MSNTILGASKPTEPSPKKKQAWTMINKLTHVFQTIRIHDVQLASKIILWKWHIF